MKSTILKIATLTLLAAAIAGTTTVRADDSATAPAPATPKKSSANKFYGPITALDTNAMTFTVNDQTYVVTATTELTLAKDNSKATLADATVGEPARGTFTKGDDGKLDVTKVRLGKKSGGKGGGKSGGKKKDASADAGAPAAPSQN